VYLNSESEFKMVICIYGASSDNISNNYITATEELGRSMSRRGHGMVFGGGTTGLMGAAARGVYECGGKIIGVTPSFFNVDGILFDHCTEMIRTETMRERKRIMEDKADAFIIVPGGIGTFDEFFEILSLKQLGRTGKPIALFNIDGYYDELEAMMHAATEKGFINPACSVLYKAFEKPDELLDYIETVGEQNFSEILRLKMTHPKGNENK